jgi:hypothetical protein
MAMMEAVRSSETSVNIYHTTQRYIPGYYHLHIREELNILILTTMYIAVERNVETTCRAGNCRNT